MGPTPRDTHSDSRTDRSALAHPSLWAGKGKQRLQLPRFSGGVSGPRAHAHTLYTSSLGSLGLSWSPFLSQTKRTKGPASPGAVKGEARFGRARTPQKVLGTGMPRKAERSAQGPPPFGFLAQPASSRAHLRAPLFPAQRKRDLGPGLGWAQLYSGGVGVA